MKLYYPEYRIRIKDEIAARRRSRELFTEAEIWYILYSVVNAVRTFEPFSVRSGELKTSHILFNDKGHVKVLNELSSHDIQTDSDTQPIPV